VQFCRNRKKQLIAGEAECLQWRLSKKFKWCCGRPGDNTLRAILRANSGGYRPDTLKYAWSPVYCLSTHCFFAPNYRPSDVPPNCDLSNLLLIFQNPPPAYRISLKILGFDSDMYAKRCQQKTTSFEIWISSTSPNWFEISTLGFMVQRLRHVETNK
jgi:hypothetical protein